MNWKSAFEAVNTALGVIKAAGDIPGVNLIPYVSVVTSAAGVIQAGMNTAVNMAPLIKNVSETFSGGLPSEDKLTALAAQIADLESRVYAPLPPREDGEPE